MFRFRLQRILELRQQREQAVAMRLAEARGAEEEARLRCEALERARDEGAQQAASAHGARPTAGQLQNLRMVVDRLDQQVRHAQQEAEGARRVVESQMDEFTVAFRERRVMDRLRDRNLSEWRAQEVVADRNLMDGIALTRHVRKPTSDNPNGGEG